MLRFLKGRNAFVIILAVALFSCTPSRNLLPPGEVPPAVRVNAEDEAYGHEVLSSLSDQFELDRDDARINRVRDIAARLTEAANANQDPWHIYVFVDDNFKNAAATRGNHIFVWTGMLKSVRDDDELATILAHEIAHVLAGHTSPDPAEATRQMLAGIAGSATGEVLAASGQARVVADLAEALIKAGMEAFLVNPDLQLKELEADQVGLFLMADAGFDPEKGVGFWERAQTDPEFSGFPIQFLSSHPSSEERYKRLRVILPQALERYATHTGAAAGYSFKPGEQGRDEYRIRGNAARPLRETWVVLENKVTVLEAPDSKARLVSTLSVGERVEVVAQHGPWLAISSPKTGFVRSVDLAPFSKHVEPSRKDGGFAQ